MSTQQSALGDYAPGVPQTDLPSHLAQTNDASHDGVCRDCGNPITISPGGIEYGHARAWNQRDHEDCPHRPSDRVDPHSHPNQAWRAHGGSD